MKLSIIVPVYNVEKYLAQCLDSLVGQTVEDYEIIVVNDGSPDNSQRIIDDYVPLLSRGLWLLLNVFHFHLRCQGRSGL